MELKFNAAILQRSYRVVQKAYHAYGFYLQNNLVVPSTAI